MQEVAQLTAAINEATFRAFLLGPKGLGYDDDCLEKQGEDDISDQPSHSALLSHFIGRALLEQQESEPTPFNLKDLNALKDRMVTKGDLLGFSKEDWETAEKALREALAKMPEGFNTPDNAQRTSSYVRIAFGALEDELSRLQATEIELQYIQNIWRQKPSEL